ncbi:ArgS-related anticodon-binding protein NrtL [Streptomyces jumonjinensis]|uniref:arginine--tRNA ligase n=1 Tax=Streptomyces jumonjinensis TaxID=1945 RepID=A0A646K9V0_STRJU|nr:DALR anticodon-binding domain-containing protein [Streptomyces jumonjinensis]MQS98897.1 arginine--tRNA ligase [Streptomyces jumonjinensis]
MTPAELSRTVLHAVRSAVADGALRVVPPESVSVERPGPGGCGDYATNVALRLARPAGQPPRAVAEALRERIAQDPAIASVEITGPGFLNITLGEGSQQALIRKVLEQGGRYGWQSAAPSPGGQDSGPDRQDPARRDSRHPAPDPRALLWDDTVARLLRTQGAAARPRAAGALTPAPPYDPSLGDDAIRWGLLAAAAHDRPRIGPQLLRQHESNPLFTVRYAHSRARALRRDAERLGFTAAPLEQVEAGGLTGLIADYPAVLASAARLGAPDRLARHLESTADALLAFQHTVLPLGDEKPMAAHRSRLAVAEAAGTVLAGGLSLLGVSAPEHL